MGYHDLTFLIRYNEAWELVKEGDNELTFPRESLGLTKCDGQPRYCLVPCKCQKGNRIRTTFQFSIFSDKVIECYNIPRPCLLNRSLVPAMGLKSNRSGL